MLDMVMEILAISYGYEAIEGDNPRTDEEVEAIC